MNVLDLCAGIGGLSLGIRLAHPTARTVCYVEREAFCVELLAEKGESGELDLAPIWSDLRTFRGKEWRDYVDCVTAGFPCQPFSCAGKRLGTEDERWLWPDIERIIDDCEPTYVFLENVPGVVIHGLGPVLESLARLGFDAEWDCFTAAQVGAPHIRERWFLLAHPQSVTERPGLREGRTQAIGRRRSGNGGGEDDADPDSRRLEEQRQPKPGRLEGAQGREPDGLCEVRELGHGADAPDTHGQGLEERKCQPGHNGQEQQTAVRGGWRTTEPAICRSHDALSNRVDRLRALGNAVVPAQAALAWRTLWGRIV